MHVDNPQRPHPANNDAPRRESPPVGETQPGRSLIVFRVGGKQHAVPTSVVEQIVPMAELDCPSGAPKMLAGYLNLGGELVPVIRLYHLLDLPETPLGLWTPLIVLRLKEGFTALLVESVDRTLIIGADAVLPLPEDQGAQGCLEGALRVEEETILLLLPDRLLLKQEHQAIVHWRQRIQQRIDDVEVAPS